MRLALPARRSRHAACLSRSASIASYFHGSSLVSGGDRSPGLRECCAVDDPVCQWSRASSNFRNFRNCAMVKTANERGVTS
ncbi:MAG: hypothetical protein JWN22_2182 [Nocardioides sp.]|jgi:hypothetical protein|nr:hypothetical protein [Nocardioides sp.]